MKRSKVKFKHEMGQVKWILQCSQKHVFIYLLPVVHVVDVIRDGRRGRSDSSGRCHANTDGSDHERGPEGEGRQSQTGDGRHAAHSRGGAAGDAGDLGLVVEGADVVGDGVERDDGLPEDLGPLSEDLVEEAQAAVDLVSQDGERPGIHLGDGEREREKAAP